MPATYVPRRAGLSRNARVEPLLSIFRTKQTDIGRERQITEPDDPTAPPVSDSSSDDEGAASQRGDIRRTTFQTDSDKDVGRKPTLIYGSRKSARTASKPTKSQNPKRPRDSEDEIDDPMRKARAAGCKDDSLGSQFRPSTFQRKAVGSKRSYGKAAGTASKSLSAPEDPPPPQNPKPEFKPVDSLDDFSSPEKPKGGAPLLPDAQDFALTPSPKKTYKPHFQANDDLDTPSPVKRFKQPTATDDDLHPSSPEKPSAKVANPKKSSDEFMRNARLLRQKRKAQKEARLRHQQEMDVSSPEVVFKLPAGMDSQDDLAYDSELDRPDGPRLEAFEPAHDIFSDNDKAVCPMCLEPVARELLDKFRKGGRMTISQQHRFCNHHKTNTARQTWSDKGYPDIDWAKLDRRIARHHQFLEDILNGGESHFGVLLAKNIKSGKNRTLLKADQNVTPGYYGSRGARIMNENIINRFSQLLRKVAVQDRLVSARGHMAFVQFVLVPELATRLIMEDMDVPPEEARTIMEESQKVGNLLNEEEDDVIVEDKEKQSDRKSTSSLSSLGDSDLSDGMA